MRRIFAYLNNRYYTLHHQTENLALDEVIVKSKDRVVFQQYIPKKCKIFGIKLYKLCDGSGYTYDMVYMIGK
jgi:hypothetical protein